jgi:hypothetical protein
MTAQQKVLLTPALQEAVEGVLYVHQLVGPAHGIVPKYDDMKVGQKVEFSVQTSYGNHWSESIALTAAMVGRPITFAIPKDVFEKKLVPDATAKLHYSVTDHSGKAVESPALSVKVEK